MHTKLVSTLFSNVTPDQASSGVKSITFNSAPQTIPTDRKIQYPHCSCQHTNCENQNDDQNHINIDQKNSNQANITKLNCKPASLKNTKTFSKLKVGSWTQCMP